MAIDCEGDTMIGIVHEAGVTARTGVVVVVGGPQYRVGSHRQFVLLARALAGAGIPVLRFDYRGMGDSTGAARDFERVAADIRHAIDAFCARPGAPGRVVLWGLCDAASALLMYGWQDPRVAGMILLNPWVHTEAGEARVRLKHYYLGRLRSGEFWRKLARLDLDFADSLASLRRYMRAALARGRVAAPAENAGPFTARMLAGLERFRGPVGLVLSGNDMTAGEFRDLLQSAPRWRAALEARLHGRLDVTDATHTFSSRAWREEVAAQSIAWVRAWDAAA